MFRLALILFCLATTAQAQCLGQNLIETLPAPERAALHDAANAQPFAKGNLWQARRGDDLVYIAGTYHLDDPRLDAIMAAISPLLTQSKTLMVEAGPEEEAALEKTLATTPGALFNTAGSGLAKSMSPQEWEALTKALARRGFPASVSETLQPWLIYTMLSLPPCALQASARDGGLDKRLVAAAMAADIPVKALEPFDTALRLFDDISLEEQSLMVRLALQTEGQADDFISTTADAYFAEESRVIWEFSRKLAKERPDTAPAQIDADFAKFETALMSDRNRAWLPRIETALQDGPVFAGFGALHLSGKDGVLNLMQAAGFEITPLP